MLLFFISLVSFGSLASLVNFYDECDRLLQSGLLSDNILFGSVGSDASVVVTKIPYSGRRVRRAHNIKIHHVCLPVFAVDFLPADVHAGGVPRDPGVLKQHSPPTTDVPGTMASICCYNIELVLILRPKQMQNCFLTMYLFMW